VTIPRCEDFSSPNEWLQARAVTQPLQNGTLPSLASDPALSASNKSTIHMKSSRSQLIDDFIHPEPWKEILPCKDLCYELVQSCPASMGFACPLGVKGEESYGSRHNSRNMTCNYPNNPWYFSQAASTAANELVVFAVLCMVLLLHLGG
jgi:calcium channel MID1